MSGLTLLGCILGVAAAVGAISVSVSLATHAFRSVRNYRRGF